MSFENKIIRILENFEESSSNEIMEILNHIKNQFHSKITRDYLQGKLQTISDSPTEEERKILCKKLKPYFDWYLQKT